MPSSTLGFHLAALATLLPHVTPRCCYQCVDKTHASYMLNHHAFAADKASPFVNGRGAQPQLRMRTLAHAKGAAWL